MTEKEFKMMMRMLARTRALFKDGADKDRKIAEKLAEVEGMISTNIDPLKFSQEPDFFINYQNKRGA